LSEILDGLLNYHAASRRQAHETAGR
jgi:hypothetical protein